MFKSKFAIFAASALTLTAITAAGFAATAQNEISHPINGGGFCVTAHNADEPRFASKRGNCSDDENLPPVIETPEEVTLVKYIIIGNVGIKNSAFPNTTYHLKITNDQGKVVHDEAQQTNKGGYDNNNFKTYDIMIPAEDIPKTRAYTVELTIFGETHTYEAKNEDFYHFANNKKQQIWYGPSFVFDPATKIFTNTRAE